MTIEIFQNYRRPARLISLALCLCFLAACSSKSASDPALRTVTDEYGRAVAIKPQPERIISLAPSITETLFALELGDRVVGVTS